MSTENSAVQQQIDNLNQLAKRGRHEMDTDDDQQNQVDQSEIKKLLLRLTSKVETMNTAMTNNDVRLNVKIDKLESALNTKIEEVKKDMEIRIQTVVSDFDQRLSKSELSMRQMCAENVTKSENVLSVRVNELRAYHENRLDRLERLSLEKDLVISGVPLENNDDPFAILGDICSALNCNLKSGDFASAFRLKSGKTNANNKRSLPIVARIQDDWVKQELLTAYFKKKNLNLTDIGFKFPARIYINERLTSTNRAIFNRAAEAKKSGIIHRFFTRRGLVYVQRAVNSQPATVQHISDLESLFALQHGKANNNGGHNSTSNMSKSNHLSTPSTANEPSTTAAANITSPAPNATPNDINNQLKPPNSDHSAMDTNVNSTVGRTNW